MRGWIRKASTIFRAPSLEATPGYDEETRLQYAGGLPEDTGEESLAE
jgi:hypothetical protein